MVKKLSHTQRTLRLIREQGQVAAIVERYIAQAGPFGRKQDLFGIIDIIALDPDRGVMGIQSTSGNCFRDHWKKLTEENAQATHDWLSTPGTSLWIYAWRKLKVKRGGKAMIWQPRIVEITLEDIN